MPGLPPAPAGDGLATRKTLFGAYPPLPVLSITDRSFLLRPYGKAGCATASLKLSKWRTVKDAELFRYLEAAGPELIKTRFGTLDCQPEDDIAVLSQKILGAAMRSYVEAEYDNLYETHQCRPHAYGHTLVARV